MRKMNIVQKGSGKMDNEKFMKEFEERIEELLVVYDNAINSGLIELAEATADLIETGLANLDGHVYNIKTETKKEVQ